MPYFCKMHPFVYIPFPDWLDNLDRHFFYAINTYMANDFMDTVMPAFRNAFFWAPFYLFIILFVLINFKKTGWIWLLFALCTFAITDLTGARIFKSLFERLRPCQDINMLGFVRLVLGRCSGGYSFVSNHAINHFGLATFIFLTFRPVFRQSWIIFIWAAVIGFAQVYVGVHYPFDVFSGALLGILIGAISGRIYNKHYEFTIFDKQLIAIH